jgi:Cdc6-like AAA superfamily ATPase
MSVFDRLKSSKKKHPPVLAVYGTPGVGKTRKLRRVGLGRS